MSARLVTLLATTLQQPLFESKSTNMYIFFPTKTFILSGLELLRLNLQEISVSVDELEAIVVESCP